ncbi:hypothetical protein AURDEDRAFT_115355 [Auricularia subglabra TFB-10046 SS5]|nr:hypothetical protein AURDEDRAFT_115355 [Auricularia subglabra TFB-10046 SS5]
MLDNFFCVVTGHAPPFVFDIRGIGLASIARPSVQDLLEYAAEHHHLRCNCKVKVGTRVWLTSIPLSDASDCEWVVTSTGWLATDAYLDGVVRTTDPSTICLVIAGEQAPLEDYLRRYREKHFVSTVVADARVFARSGASPVLPSQGSLRFNELCSLPGFTFVDKSEPLRDLLEHSWYGPINIIRRPKGFGKTTLLSMFDAYFDPYSACAYFPFTFTHASMPIIGHHGQLLVFALDLADLSFNPSMGDEALEAECDRLLDAAAQQFYTRYQKLWLVPEEERTRPGGSPTFDALIRWAGREEWQLCFTIDNYTSPVLDGPNDDYEYAISKHIFDTFRNLLYSNAICYGLIVGDDVDHAAQWHGLPDVFNDLTSDPTFAGTIGFTLDEIAALEHVFPGDLITAVRSRALSPPNPKATRIFAASDVLRLARWLSRPDSPAPVEILTVDFDPLPVVVPLPVPLDPMDYEDVIDWGAEMDRRFGRLSDDEASSDQPALTADNSSDGSSSTAPSPERDQMMPRPPEFEPPSPSERYDKKLWSSDRL